MPAEDVQEIEATEGGAPPAGAPLRVNRALVSVSDKTGVVDFVRGLADLGVEILSTGGTAAVLREAGLDVVEVSDFTGQQEILGGRVKTLHPRLHGALLARRDDAEHMATLEREGIEPIDLVCVNLYPFRRTIAQPGVTEADAIENIDIGGPTMIRAAAKNHRFVAVVVRPESYDAVLAELEASDGTISEETRHWLANEAFAEIAQYDAGISRWFGMRYEAFPTYWAFSYEKYLDLAYGENPHQKAALYVESGARAHILSDAAKLHGRELSFNNVLDLDAATKLLDDLPEPAVVIVKHNNPCGVAIGDTVGEAYEKALACDPLSAYGGVIAINREVDIDLARRLHDNFVEALIAPSYGDGALDLLMAKESIRILADPLLRDHEPRERDVKRVRGGMLVQTPDLLEEDRESMTVPTYAKPTEEQWRDLWFAWVVCKHVRSNAIVIARDGATLGIGAGQMSRVDAVRIAIEKARIAREDEADELLRGSVVASDAFFPFPDGPQLAINAGATALIQPGGSKRDEIIVIACDEAGAAMVMTGRRHFRH